MKTPALFALAILTAVLITGCQQPVNQPYYISGVSGGAGAGLSKDDKPDNVNGTISVQFSPNPNYPKPAAK